MMRRLPASRENSVKYPGEFRILPPFRQISSHFLPLKPAYNLLAELNRQKTGLDTFLLIIVDLTPKISFQDNRLDQ